MGANEVIPRLFQGSMPPTGRLPAINVLVLMAQEYQPPARAFPGSTVVHAPIDDDMWKVTLQDRMTIKRAAASVVHHLRRGRSVLVTCNQGLNRSGVVTALAIRNVMPQVSPAQAIKLIRKARGPLALSNPRFVELIEETR